MKENIPNQKGIGSMKMDLRVTVESSKLDKAMDKVEDAMCKGWFNGDRDAYEEWAGDRVADALMTFLNTLESECHVLIDFCEDKDFDKIFGE